MTPGKAVKAPVVMLVLPSALRWMEALASQTQTRYLQPQSGAVYSTKMPEATLQSSVLPAKLTECLAQDLGTIPVSEVERKSRLREILRANGAKSMNTQLKLATSTSL